jgi:Methyltransferase domain
VERIGIEPATSGPRATTLAADLERMASESEPGVVSTYEPATYWVDRHSQLKGDIRSVGNRGVSVEDNEKGYVNRAAVLSKLLTEDLAVAEGSALIEFGCGIGMQAPVIVETGLEYTGVDISPDALTAARLGVRRAGSSKRMSEHSAPTPSSTSRSPATSSATWLPSPTGVRCSGTWPPASDPEAT